MTDQPRHITAQVSNGDGEITNDVVIDTETGHTVSTEEMSADVKELFGLFGQYAAEAEEGEDHADGNHT
jgi:hypothetical protein